MTLADGTPLSAALGIGAFAELTLVAAGQAVKIDPRARPEAAGLIGCGIMAGFGAAVNTGEVSFVSETIGIDQVDEAFHRMERGEVLRSVVVL